MIPVGYPYISVRIGRAWRGQPQRRLTSEALRLLVLHDGGGQAATGLKDRGGVGAVRAAL